MIGEFMKTKLSIAALVAGGMMVATTGTASAADLGGDCCADLEERVATLEATTARKGNRKVSLKIYGHVNQALLIWDDGEDSDAYIVDNDHSSTRIGFKGKAKINSDWSAGYKIEIQFESSSSSNVNATTDDDSNSISLRKSSMYVKSKQLGKLTWGLDSVATDDVTHDAFKYIGLANHARPDAHYIRGFQFRNADGTINATADVGRLCGAASSDNDACFDIGSRRNSIRYDTPTVGGFKLSAAWGEDDFYDVALRYAGEFGGVRIAASVGYAEWDPNNTGGNEESASDGEQSIAGSVSIMHTPTGLFLNGSYRNTEVEYAGVAGDVDSDSYYIQAGIQQRWNSLGKTTIYGEYANSEDGLLTSADRSGTGITGSELERWGVGITQNIDAAAMQLYIVYQHHEAEIDGIGADLQDIDNVVIGGTIKF